MSDFNNNFWNWWVIVITVGGILFCVLLLWMQSRARNTKGQVTGHVWDENLEAVSYTHLTLPTTSRV